MCAESQSEPERSAVYPPLLCHQGVVLVLKFGERQVIKLHYAYLIQEDRIRGGGGRRGSCSTNTE